MKWIYAKYYIQYVKDNLGEIKKTSVYWYLRAFFLKRSVFILGII